MSHRCSVSLFAAATMLVSASLLSPGLVSAAPSDEVKCAQAIAKSMSTCTKKAIFQHAKCYKKTGAVCPANDDKLTKAELKVGSLIRKKCGTSAVILAAGYTGYTTANELTNLSVAFGKSCLNHAVAATTRTYGSDGSFYPPADKDGQKCLFGAAKATGKYISKALKDISKCVETGCTFDFSALATDAVAAVDKKCVDLSAIQGTDSTTYIAGATDQIPSTVASPCDPMDATRCAYPFPNDQFSTGGSDGGRQLNLGPRTVTAVGNGTPIDPTRWNETDGFSIGPMILLQDTDLDLAMTGAAPITDLAQSLDPSAPMVLIDAETGDKQLMWWERDVQGASIADQPIIGRVAKNLQENHRYIVAIRNAKDAAGDPVPAGSEFALYRDNTPTSLLPVEARRAHMEDIFDILVNDAGMVRAELYLAWDFTTQSSDSTRRRLLAMRDDTSDILGASAPSFTVDTITPAPRPGIFRQVDGTFEVPLYLNDGGVPGSTLRTDGNGTPVNEGDFFTASFGCIIPDAATTGGGAPAVPARVSLYGHGLLGSHTEVHNGSGGNVADMSSEHNIIFCATDWTGFASEDQLFAVQVVNGFSNFPTFIDRQHQGILNFMTLGRLLTHASGFASDPAFQVGGESMLDTSDLFYDGNSQGGILGGVLAAFEQQATRFSLGVPGMNYSTLLHRSVDFDPFNVFLEATYPESLDRNLLLSMAQNIWDRTDPNGHVNHVTADPYPGTPAKKVLMHVAFGDHQVAPLTAEIAARNHGASIHTPTLSIGKVVPEVTPYYDIPAIPAYPFDGSALVIWDSGNPAPPIDNIPPPDVVNPSPEWDDLLPCAQSSSGGDPHSCPRKNVDARQQKSDFLQTGGEVTDVCSGAACLAP